VEDPTASEINVARTYDDEVWLPDGAGGFQRVDSRVIRIRHGGQSVALIAPNTRQRLRRRRRQNAVAIITGVIILLIVFWLLL
jgi:hypothetical protein